MIRTGHGSDEERARFRAEAEAVARLRHPGIVQVHDVGECQGQMYCALEYLPGGTLAGKLRNNPLPARAAAHVVEVLARAMHHAHQANLVHRALKPQNVLLGEDRPAPEEWVLKVADFGLAKFLDRDAGVTQADVVMGTPSYMAPEQALGRAGGFGVGPPGDRSLLCW